MNYEKTTKTFKLVIEVVVEGCCEPDPRFNFPSTEEIAIKNVARAIFEASQGCFGDDKGSFYYLGGHKLHEPKLM